MYLKSLNRSNGKSSASTKKPKTSASHNVLAKGHYPLPSDMLKRISTPYDWTQAVEQYQNQFDVSSINISINEVETEIVLSTPVSVVDADKSQYRVFQERTESGDALQLLVEETTVNEIMELSKLRLPVRCADYQQSQTELIQSDIHLIRAPELSPVPSPCDDFLAGCPFPIEPIEFRLFSKSFRRTGKFFTY